LAIPHSGRAYLFTGATTETAIQVFAKRFGRVPQPALNNGAHQIKPAAWAVIFIARNYVGGAGFQTEATVNAGEEFVFLLHQFHPQY
jgi:hypothetical protein